MTDTNKRSSGFAQARFQNLASTVLSTTTITTTTAFSPPLLQTSLPLPPLPFCHPGGSGGRQRVPRHIHHHLGWSLVTDVIRRTDKRHRRRNQCAKGQVAYVCVQITVYLGHPWSGPGWRTAPMPEDDDSPRFLGAPAPTLVPPDCLRCHCLPFPFSKCEPRWSLDPRGFKGSRIHRELLTDSAVSMPSSERDRGRGTKPPFSLFLLQKRGSNPPIIRPV